MTRSLAWFAGLYCASVSLFAIAVMALRCLLAQVG